MNDVRYVSRPSLVLLLLAYYYYYYYYYWLCVSDVGLLRCTRDRYWTTTMNCETS